MRKPAKRIVRCTNTDCNRKFLATWSSTPSICPVCEARAALHPKFIVTKDDE